MLSDIIRRDASRRWRHKKWRQHEWNRFYWQLQDINELERRLALSGKTLDERNIETREDIRVRMRQIARDMLVYQHWPPFLWRAAIRWYYRDYIPIAKLW